MVIAKASRTGYCKRLNSNDISVGIIGMLCNSTSSPLNFPFKIRASMILYHLFHWSLGHLVINFFGLAHNKYAKFHYNHHRGLTLENHGMPLLESGMPLFSRIGPQGTVGHLLNGNLVTGLFVT
jgi:hypothetical protein